MSYLSPQEKKQIRKLRKKIGYQHIEISFDADDLSFAGTYHYFDNFLKILALDKLLSEQLHIDRRERLYAHADYLKLLSDAVLYDIDRIENIGLLADDSLLLKLRNLASIPDAETLRNFLEAFTTDDLKSLLKVNQAILSKAAPAREPRLVTFISDTSVLTVYGQQEHSAVGYNPQKPGRLSYAPKFCFLDRGDLINFRLEPGNSVAKTDWESFFDESFSLMPDGAYLADARLDAGFFAEQVPQYFEAKSITYYLKAKVDPRMRQAFAALPDDYFTALSESQVELALGPYRPDTWEQERNFLVIRKPKPTKRSAQLTLFSEPAYIYQAIVTNSTLSKEEIFAKYNSGAVVEGFIKELAYEFFIDRINSQKYLANAAYFALKCITYNLVHLFKELIVTGNWAKASLKTLRAYLLKIPARLAAAGRGLRVHLPHSFIFKERLGLIQRNLLRLASTLAVV
jgi:hypothetical protein